MSEILPFWRLLLDGLWITILVAVLGIVLAGVVAFTAGLARLSRFWFVRAPAALFVETFRGTSLLVQLFWFFFALPFFGIQLEPITAAVLALGLNEGAYAAEIVRGSILGRPRGQDEAGIALGMSRSQRLRRILIPQAVPSMLPPFGNVAVDLLKNTALVSLVTVSDLTFSAQSIRNVTGETTAVFLTILVMYYVLSLLIGALVSFLERRFDVTRVGRKPDLVASTGGVRA